MFILIAPLFSGYILEDYFNDMVAEGVSSFFALSTLFYINKKGYINYYNVLNLKIYFYCFVALSIYASFTSLIYVIFDYNHLSTLMFLYLWFLPVFIFFILYTKVVNDKFIQDFYVSVGLLSFIVSIAGILQILDYISYPPIDIFRARGLSRSTLNYASILLVGFSSALCINKPFIKVIFCSVIFLGIVASLSRGVMISALIITFFAFYHQKKSIKLFFLIVLILLIISFSGIDIVRDRFLSSFDFQNDETNIDRMSAWIQFIERFTIIGNGVGTIGSGASRFGQSENFESYVLGLIYQCGLPAFISIVLLTSLFIKIMIKFYKSNLYLRKKATLIFGISIAFFVQMCVQASFENPSAFLLAWLLFLFVFLDFKNASLNFSTKNKL